MFVQNFIMLSAAVHKLQTFYPISQW